MKRTPLARRTPLRAVASLVSRTRPKRGTRDAIPADHKVLVWVRARGCCEVCEIDLEDSGASFNYHHRDARGMGGSRDPRRHSPSNLMLVCGMGNALGCHRDIEINRSWSFGQGYLVRTGYDPAEVAVRMHAAWWLLAHDGSVREVAA